MQNTKTVTINGRSYDAVTGMLMEDTGVENTTPMLSTPSSPSRQAPAAIHAPTMQRSQTLRRRATSKPQKSTTAPEPKPQPTVHRRTLARPVHTGVQPPHTTALRRAKPAHLQPIQPVIPAKPQASQVAPKPSAPRPMSDIAPQPHPVAQKAHLAQHTRATPAAHAPKPAHDIKNEAIESALSTAVRNEKQHKQPRKRRLSRFASVGASALALLLLGGYFTYINMPNLSVRVAATQAGFDATYPEYRPDGYRLSGPIAAKDNEVSMKFASTAGTQNFTLKQEKSSWDSLAVREYVANLSDDNAITTAVDGLTIYIYGSNAAWVNGGVLYTMNGDAPLSGEQIRRIATSM